MARIVLVRHGASAYVHHTGPIDRPGVHAWRDAYDVTGIQPDNQAPHSLMQLAIEAKHIVASDVGGYDNWSTWSFAHESSR